MKKKPAKKAAKVTKAAPKRKAKREPEPDVNQLAHHLVKMTTEPTEVEAVAAPTSIDISRVMAELGRRGGGSAGRSGRSG